MTLAALFLYSSMDLPVLYPINEEMADIKVSLDWSSNASQAFYKMFDLVENNIFGGRFFFKLKFQRFSKINFSCQCCLKSKDNLLVNCNEIDQKAFVFYRVINLFSHVQFSLELIFNVLLNSHIWEKKSIFL